MNNLIVADISNFTGHFDAHTYRQAGHVLVAMKASEGLNFVDFRHRGFALNAGLNHVAVAHYHFGRPDANPNGGAEEADFFLHVTRGLLGPHDYVVYDGERAQNGAFGLDVQHCRSFDNRIREQTRYKTILYASASVLGGASDALGGDNKRDWDANYSNQGDTHAPGHVTVLRQFTDGVFGPEPHSVAGIGQCDVNIMRGEFARQVLANA